MARKNAVRVSPSTGNVFRDLFGSGTLIDMRARLGVGVRLVVKPSRSRSAA
jgi:hypothetical protein